LVPPFGATLTILMMLPDAAIFPSAIRAQSRSDLGYEGVRLNSREFTALIYAGSLLAGFLGALTGLGEIKGRDRLTVPSPSSLRWVSG
jgi:hypothetical protein